MKGANSEAVGDISVSKAGQANRRSANATRIVVILILIAAVAAGCYFLLKKPVPVKAAKKPVAVSVAVAKSETVPIEIRTTGNILAYSSVNITPQVSGQLKKVCFTQGDYVKKGQVLFLIDPRTYQAALDQDMGKVQEDKANIQVAIANMKKDEATVEQYRATLTKDKASLGYAAVEAKRYTDLVKQGAVSKEQADQMNTSNSTAAAQIVADSEQIKNEQAVVNSDNAQIGTARATLEADQAMAENAKIQLDWCTIRAPLDGRTGQLQIYEGNVVAANSTTPIINIAQVQPIFVQFTIPEEFLDQVRRSMTKGNLRIQALLEGAAKDYVTGSASFMDNTVNTTSGTALLRASFANTESRMYPGQFVDVLVTMPPAAPSIVVPLAAIQTTQKGNAVYVVKPDNTVVLNQVELQRSTEDFAALASGVNAGDTVVTDGQLQLTPGQAVTIVTDTGSGGHHKHGSSTSPDGSLNSNSAGGDVDGSGQDNPLPTGTGANGKAWNADPGYGSQKTPAPSTEDTSAPANPATYGGKTGGANNTGGAFAPLAGATHPGEHSGLGMRHRH